MQRLNVRLSCCLLATALLVPAAWPTWSIVIVDRETKEIAIGSATCITGTNLRKYVPIVLVDVGAGAAQSAVDLRALNRQRIRAGFEAGLHPLAILADLEAHDGRHQTRQYGIVDTRGRAVTFSGTQNGAYASGLVGSFGNLVYAIQGNVITGQPVLDEAEAAIIVTPGGLPEKLMAAMEAARAMGGDGRCSCEPADPTGCGSPPPAFDKSAHVGFMIVTRRGDIDGVCTRNRGCANGTYYMALNVRDQTADDPDPVFQLRDLFDAWRADLVGVADAVESQTTIAPDRLLAGSGQSATLTIELRDWQGLPAVGVSSVEVSHDPRGSAGSSTIGQVSDLGDGVYQVTLTVGTTPGRDRFLIEVFDAVGQRPLIPSPVLIVQDPRADLNHDGLVDRNDLAILLGAYGIDDAGDIDGDGRTGLNDLALMMSNL